MCACDHVGMDAQGRLALEYAQLVAYQQRGTAGLPQRSFLCRMGEAGDSQ